MSKTDKKKLFIELRAKGLSYAKIAKELSISKSTCSSWEAELKDRIQELQDLQLNELYTLYGMDREARIQRVGEALKDINEALKEKDLKELPADTLLKLKLKYEQELKAEYIQPEQSYSFKDFSNDEAMEALNNIYKQQQLGTITPAQAKAQIATIAEIMQTKRLIDSWAVYT